MAYLTGIEHILYVMDQDEYASKQGDTADPSFGFIDNNALQSNAKALFINPGSKPTVQTSVIEAEAVGFIAGRGRSRSIVSGGFSFYLDNSGSLDYFVQNILDDTTFAIDDSTYARTPGKGEFSIKGKNDKSLAIAGIMNGVFYVIQNAYVTGLTIGASDPTSLVTVDVEITAASNTVTEDDSPLIATQDATPTVFPTFISSKSCQLTSFTYGAANSGSGIVPFTGLSIGFQKPMEVPTIIQGTTTLFDESTAPTKVEVSTKRESLLKSAKKPVTTGNKTLTSSFNVPYQKESAWATFFKDIINGQTSSTGAVNFKLGEDETATTVQLNNIEFNGVDFSDLGEDVVEFPISVNAYEASSSLGELKLQGVTHA